LLGLPLIELLIAIEIALLLLAVAIPHGVSKCPRRKIVRFVAATVFANDGGKSWPDN